MTRSLLGYLPVVVAIALPLVLAHDLDDHSNNRIESRQFRRPQSFGRRLLIKRCSECPGNECKVIGMQRFSEPRCEALGSLGSPCRMWQEPENKTLHFPNEILICKNVHTQFCPCGPGLVCEDAECTRPDSKPRLQQLEPRSELDTAWQVFDDYQI